jgi:hypothetical protein
MGGRGSAEPSRQLRDGSAGAWVCDPSPSLVLFSYVIAHERCPTGT